MAEVSVSQVGARFIARCSYEDRAVPREAGFRWDPAAKCWWTNKPEIAARLSDPASAAKLMAEAAAKQTLRAESIEASRAAEADIDLPCPEGLAYLPYQRAGIAFALRHDSVLFGDEMGLGKTIQAIGTINADASVSRVLIICPASLKLNWRNELRRWLTRAFDIIVASGQDCPVDWAGEHGRLIVIANYDIADKHRAALMGGRWDMLICDEAHYLKNSDAKRTKAIIGADAKKGKDAIPGLRARRRIMLTGTPIPNRPIEGQPLFHFLAPENKNFSFFPYAKRYCGASAGRFGWDFSGSSNLQQLQDELRATIMIRRLKADVLTELPAKRRAVIEIADNGSTGAVKAEIAAWEANEDRMLAVRAAVELAKASDRPEDYSAAVDRLKEAATAAFAEMSRLRHETAVATVPYVIDHVRDIVEQGRKVIVFAHHRDVIEALHAAFAGAVMVYGGMAIEDRQRSVERFQGDPECMVFVGGILAAGVGLTLTASSHVVFAELDWVPGNVTQAEDRAHRIGQKDMVTVEHFVLEGSLSARMAHDMVDKQDVIDRALDKIEPAKEPVIPVAQGERGATESTTRSAIEKAAESMTAARIAAVHEGLKMLAAMDGDRAREINGAGFSKLDVAIGHSLAQRAFLTARQAALGAKLVNKYRRQLPDSIAEGAKAIVSPHIRPCEK